MLHQKIWKYYQCTDKAHAQVPKTLVVCCAYLHLRQHAGQQSEGHAGPKEGIPIGDSRELLCPGGGIGVPNAGGQAGQGPRLPQQAIHEACCQCTHSRIRPGLCFRKRRVGTQQQVYDRLQLVTCTAITSCQC